MKLFFKLNGIYFVFKYKLFLDLFLNILVYQYQTLLIFFKISRKNTNFISNIFRYYHLHSYYFKITHVVPTVITQL